MIKNWNQSDLRLRKNEWSKDLKSMKREGNWIDNHGGILYKMLKNYYVIHFGEKFDQF